MTGFVVQSHICCANIKIMKLVQWAQKVFGHLCLQKCHCNNQNIKTSGIKLNIKLFLRKILSKTFYKNKMVDCIVDNF